jgi:hypothetical protein
MSVKLLWVSTQVTFPVPIYLVSHTWFPSTSGYRFPLIPHLPVTRCTRTPIYLYFHSYVPRIRQVLLVPLSPYVRHYPYPCSLSQVSHMVHGSASLFPVSSHVHDLWGATGT